ncbi:hypothetical protein [Methylobacterium dankookense]|uniref:Uncharacterized protein n=1 Tax=Methylobacterium dankookense TaxID=560405 RepID=A0A564FVX2_9HYPH|nr:hypothetical protein [Methylobacterium dankookense]GJD55372.1 hypothetical protein IFDJLNFL_1257 [Methylobacterium dankookense]VUF12253.1 hypothetical protein MTDSW087_01942 [Methylobacterium dankookense]
MVKLAALVVLSAALFLPNPAAAQASAQGARQGSWQGTWQGTWNAYPDPRTWRAPQQSVEGPRLGSPRDPTGILRGQGVSSRHGGMGNMGGGSGRSANTGVGLGGIGANQGARF